MRQWIEYAVENYRGKNSFGFQLAKDLKERQIAQAIERYARGVKPQEVVALMDTSVFRSGKTGFLLTERYLYSDKYKEEVPVSLMFLKEVSVRPENKSCCVLTFKDDSTRDVDVSVFLDVVDVLKLIVEQRDKHEQESDDEGLTESGQSKSAEAPENEDGDAHKRLGGRRKHPENAAGMKDSEYDAGMAESRTVFEDSAEDFLRTVRSEEPVNGGLAAERFSDRSLAAEGAMEDAAGPGEPAKASGYKGIMVESVKPAENVRIAKEHGESDDIGDAGSQEVSGLPIEIIPIDEFEESGESEETREQRWLAEFSQSGESIDLILEDDSEFLQSRGEPEAPGQEGVGGNEALQGGFAEKEEPDSVEEPFEELLKKAEAGDRAAMYRVAELYFTGGKPEGAEDVQHIQNARPALDTEQAEDVRQVQNAKPGQDTKQALKWFRESARLEYVPAMLRMMLFYREGEFVKKNYTLSLSWAKKAAATGDQKGQYALVDSYLYGLDGKQDTGAGLALLSKMAELGDESAKRTADDVLNKIKEAKERFDAGIKNPSTASGYYEMGMYCLKGDGFYNYPREAVRYLKKAAEKEHVHAEYQLALAYHTGEGVKKDEDECIRWLEKAAAKSHKEAGELLADLQEKRRIRQEKSEFKNHLRQAEKGDAYAQSRTAELYLHGIGVKQDIEKGIEWYEKASETDEGYAARQLAKLYSEGDLVPADPEKAAYWRMVGGVLDEL